MPRISVWLKIWDTLRPGGVTRRGTCRGGICSICKGVWADGLCQGASVRMPGFPSRIFTLWLISLCIVIAISCVFWVFFKINNAPSFILCGENYCIFRELRSSGSQCNVLVHPHCSQRQKLLAETLVKCTVQKKKISACHENLESVHLEVHQESNVSPPL